VKTISATLPRSAPVPVLGTNIALLQLRRRPLWKVETVCDFLDITAIAALHLIEDGSLPWGFEIGVGPNRTRGEVRILAHCAWERAHGPIKNIGPGAKLDFNAVVELILPHHRPTFKGTELQRLFSCTAQHVGALRRGGELKMIREPRPQSGPNASPHFTRESVIRFLEKRRML
jgi:hypothetical protein